MRTAFRTMTDAQRFALVQGVVYSLVGIAGFPLTGLAHFAGPLHSTLLVLSVTPLHNLVHLALGGVWLAGSRTPRGARRTNVALGCLLGLVTVLGFSHALGFLGIHGLEDPDNFVHLVTGALALYFGSVGAEATSRVATERA